MLCADWVTEAGYLPSRSFTEGVDIIAIHVEGTVYYDRDRVSWQLMEGKGMVSSGVREGCRGTDLGELCKGSWAGYEE